MMRLCRVIMKLLLLTKMGNWMNMKIDDLHETASELKERSKRVKIKGKAAAILNFYFIIF